MSEESKINDLEQIMKLMQLYKIDRVELGDIKVAKSYHEFPQTVENKQEPIDDDEALFYSAD